MTDAGWTMIVNPIAGQSSAEKKWPTIEALLEKYEVSFNRHNTTHPGHALTLVPQLIRNGARKFLILGGDGTVNETINAILGQRQVPVSEFTIGLIPMGTGNDWGKTIGIPSDLEAMVKLIHDAPVFTQDVGKVTYLEGSELKERYFVNIAGMGYDAFVTDAINKLKAKGKGGKTSYLMGLVSCLVKYKALPCKYYVDEKATNATVFSLVVAICQYNGGGMRQAPKAIPDDGLLDMTVIHKLPKWDVIKNVKNMFDGTFVKHPKVSLFRDQLIRVEGPPEFRLEVDGEVIGHGPAEFSVIPKCLNVIATGEIPEPSNN